MSDTTWTKHYTDPAHALATAANHSWLSRLNCGIRLPKLHACRDHHLVFERLHGRTPGPLDVGPLADALGTLHATAGIRLYPARLDQPFQAEHGLVIPDFPTGRHDVLAQVPVAIADLPATIYKDSNIRNFLVTDTGIAIVDFDDLTLAPYGYDLAKLVVSIAMTHGPPNESEILNAVHAYNRRTRTVSPRAVCMPQQLKRYCELHHLLTSKYLHHHGYQHTWPQVRPWHEETNADNTDLPQSQ